MSEESLNFADFSAEKRAEGMLLVMRCLLVAFYILFVGCAFLVCYLSRIIPLFAIAPILLWILVYFTWRYVSYDIHYTFDHGIMTFAHVYANRTKRIKKVRLTVQIRDAVYLGHLDAAETAEWREQVKVVYDFLPSRKAADAVMLVTQDNRAIAFVCPPNMRKLMIRFCHAQKLA